MQPAISSRCEGMLERVRNPEISTPDPPSGAEEPIRAEVLSAERMTQQGRELAGQHRIGRSPSTLDFAARVTDDGMVLKDCYLTISRALQQERAITPAARWLVDNFHVVEEQIAEISANLPRRHFRALKQLESGPLVGYPRPYALAHFYVAHSDSQFDALLLERFVAAYQEVMPLEMGELWALSVMLRVVMLENLRRIATRVARSLAARATADRYADSLAQRSGPDIAAGAGAEAGPAVAPSIDVPSGSGRYPFILQLAHRLQRLGPEAATTLAWVDTELTKDHVSVDDIAQREHARQGANNLTVRNLIMSLRAITSFDWRSFFDDVSLVERALHEDPDYGKMDFLTRDRYRHSIEELAAHSGRLEVEVAATACRMSSGDPQGRDLGYFLIADGRPQFEELIHYRPRLSQRLRRAFIANASSASFASIALLTAGVLALSLRFGVGPADAPWYGWLALGLLGLLPASDFAVGCVNNVLVRVFPPRHLPRLSLDEGLSAELRTLVVMPVMLGSEAEIERHAGQLEVHALANPGPNLCFGLLSDWRDAQFETLPADAALLRKAQVAISSLNDRYVAAGDEPRFYLFHRVRRWNEGEGFWMGWERKRGKLVELNRLLRGAADTSFIALDTGGVAAPRSIRYVATLDADTRVPIDGIAKLVGTAAHPRNQPRFDARQGRVVEGYGIFQPRVTPLLPARDERSFYREMITGASGLDPYAGAVSDVYQDVFGVGIFTGKGLYDVDVFTRALGERVPENSLLSHDLFEGIFARCALVSDTEFFEEFPSHSEVAAARLHRWTRGDWQLLPWLIGARGRGMPLLGRWQLLDNIRRSLSAPAALALLIVACAITHSRLFVWLALVVLPYAAPTLLRAAERLAARPRGCTRVAHLKMAGLDMAADLGRAAMALTLLAQNAWLMLDAIARALVRMLFTRRHLLEWVTAAQMQANAGGQYALREFAWPLKSSTIVVTGSVLFLLLANPAGLRAAAPLLLLWWLAPVLARALSVPREHPEPAEELDPAGVEPLRAIARRTWCFFETFVGAEDNHLPPDNFQETPHPVVAHRSSPTNFGLYLLSTLAARDFGWLGSLDMCSRLQATLGTFAKLERCNGHFLNWYETRTLASLEPRYVSTVDSGNLAGHLLTLAQACQELLRQPAVRVAMLDGAQDTLGLVLDAIARIDDRRRSSVVHATELRAAADSLLKLLDEAREEPFALAARIAELHVAAMGFADLVQAFCAERGGDESQLQRWSQMLLRDLESQQRDLAALLPWSQRPLPTGLAANTQALLVAAAGEPLQSLPLHCRALAAGLEDSHAALRRDLMQGATGCEALIDALFQISATSERYFSEMHFGFLFDRSRHLFSIGYRVRDGALDEGFYDLLASEARLASLVAIAKGDAPRSHWFRLGRRLAGSTGGPLLLSWSGSMFEYLMPALVMKSPRDSLLDQTCRRVVQRQIEYGVERGVPWGVSESALNVRDRELTYQYSDFGVPGLGLKRGLGNNLVIAPYATALAAMFAPNAALANLQRLAGAGALGPYGYYEALDFTESRLEEKQEVAIVKAYMAHHQGMSLVALANTLQDCVMQQRFHREPRIQAAELLLQEQGARHLSIPRLVSDETPQESVLEPSTDFERRFTSPATPVPATLLLSNRHYTVMITAAGGGLSSCDGRAVTRWREDLTRDCWGSFFYVRDVETGRAHCAGYQPGLAPPDRYEALFTEDRATLRRRDGGLETTLEVLVSPEDNAELRRVTLSNDGSRDRLLDVTSYAEIVLAPLAADIAHPAFSNLFVQTEFLPEFGCLLATRRPRSAHETQVWAAQVLVGVRGPAQRLEFETDRTRFVGRGHSVRDPVAVVDGRPLSNTTGPVLDPIFSLRTRVLVRAGDSVALTFVTLIATSREQALGLAEKYANAAIFERVATLSWTSARAELYHMRIEPAEARLFQALAGHLLYSNPELRLAGDLMSANVLSASGLWRFGISGDRPIVAIRCESQDDRDFLQQLLRAQEYWRNKRLLIDVVVINERAYSYVQDLQRELEELARSARVQLGGDSPDERGGIYILRRDQINAEEYTLLLTAAKVVLRPGQGSLAEQLLRPGPEPASETTVLPQPSLTVTAPPLQLPALEFFNGLGGFADDGREYVIALDGRQQTPAPWVNVIANSQAGCIVSELGSMCSWAGNSRENQLTPWSNDPVSDPSGEAFFLRDEDDGAVWSPTAQPIRLRGARYVTRHGQGCSRFQLVAGSIETDLQIFVAAEDPVKIATLRITNHGRDRRRLSVTAYVEWVLGDQRGKHAPYIVTEIDAASGAMLVRNPWNVEFGQRVGFTDMGGRQQSWTGSRREFIGRNGALSAPRAMRLDLQLSGRVGAGLDPCCAMRSAVMLEPGASEEVVFVLGQADTADLARELVLRYRRSDAQAVLRAVKLRWQNLLDTLQVHTPDRAFDLLVNRWLPYQTLSCRFWGRAAFYQAGGAYGFRDQLQDSLMLVTFAPELAREHLLRAGARQFVEGDVQHWWHPPTGRGVRTRFSDDRVWLPYVAAHYLDVTGDVAVLDEPLPFLAGMALAPGQEDAHFQPQTTEATASLYEHCARALDISLATGVHGLPLMGAGDWNDGMNRVGQGGKGESVWLAWFLITVLRRFASVATARSDAARAQNWLEHADSLLHATETQGWDGDWYRRAFFDDGTPLGSASNMECRIDSIAQSWAVICGAGDRQRSEQAMDSMRRYLVRHEDELILLFTPPFDRAPQDPGYIKGYLPGLRENGGQYTHAAVWAVIASAMLGRRQEAAEMFDMLNPIRRTTNRTGVLAYKVEPYVLAADVYSQAPHARRGGWTWYTGAAGWMHRAATEWLLGIRLRHGHIEICPCVRPEWLSYSLRYRSGASDYLIEVESAAAGAGQIERIELDGREIAGTKVPLLADGAAHVVRVSLH
jgi:cyclic beta-1,2-glucan synthetase